MWALPELNWPHRTTKYKFTRAVAMLSIHPAIHESPLEIGLASGFIL